MQSTNKTINLPPLVSTFDLTDAVSRHKLAEQIRLDIDEYCLQAYSDSEPRKHLGASIIGHKCDRYLWYTFRWMFKEKHTGRMQRLFNRGHLEESRYIEWLRGIGCEFLDSDTEQTRMIGVSGHYGGSRDGNLLLKRYGIAEPVLVSFKTIHTKGFCELAGNASIQQSKPEHWAQECAYGFKFNIHYCLYLTINKNDDDIYAEMLELDLAYGKTLEERARRIIVAVTAPPRISNVPSWYECTYCPAKQICHFNAEPLHNCRSCRYAAPKEEAMWYCNHYNQTIPAEFIPKGCQAWIPIK